MSKFDVKQIYVVIMNTFGRTHVTNNITVINIFISFGDLQFDKWHFIFKIRLTDGNQVYFSQLLPLNFQNVFVSQFKPI